jgi:hypothetical protein
VLATLIKIHEDMAPVILAAGGVTLIWGIVVLILASRRGAESSSGAAGAIRGGVAGMRIFRVLLVITAALGVIQAIIGGLMYLNGARPGDGLHYVYGGIVLLAIPVAYVYSDQAKVRRDIIIMVIAALAVIGAAIRALMTGHP